MASKEESKLRPVAVSVGIRIPILESTSRQEKDRVIFYPDELPEDHNELTDVLRAVFAPIKVWRACALEYHRQGYDAQFEQLLIELLNALTAPEVDLFYKDVEAEGYMEGVIDIYVALAAKELSHIGRCKQVPLAAQSQESSAEHTRKFKEYVKLVDDRQRINEYSWLVQGFYEIVQGDLRRAEDQFKYVHDRAAKSQGQSTTKKKYLYAALAGMGIVAFANQRYEQALAHLVKAVQANPLASGASVRLAIACCCFKLEQYDRAKLALEKCARIDPANVKVLVLLALVEQVAAKKDRTNRLQFRRNAHEYSLLAHSIDRTNAPALNLLANHQFHSWTRTSFDRGGCFVLGPAHLLVPTASLGDCLLPQNQLRIDAAGSGTDASSPVHKILAICSNAADFPALSPELAAIFSSDWGIAMSQQEVTVVTVSPRLPPTVLARDSAVPGLCVVPCARVECKDLLAVERYAQQAIRHASNSAVVAESHYLLGKVAHSLGDADLALDLYWQALKGAPDMALPAFGAAQIMLSRREYPNSLELFEKVLLKNPEDKDTQAYVMLLRAVLKKEPAQFDRLKEIAPGFQHEVELWLIQGQLRQGDPAEFKNALKCFLTAKDCLDHEASLGAEGARAVPATVLSNISVLQHSLGNLDKALLYSKQTLLAFRVPAPASSSPPPDAGPDFQSAELEGVFYQWAEQGVCRVTVGEAPASSRQERFLVVGSADGEGNGESVSLLLLVAVGQQVMVGGVKYLVDAIPSASEMLCSSAVKLGRVSASTPAPAQYEVRVKEPFGNFCDSSLTYCFNFARLLEDEGHTRAATELYEHILKRHPSFIECYLRLSMLSCEMGRFKEASVWLSRALVVKEDEADATLCLGDLYLRSGNLEDSKKCFEKICSANRHDARAMLSLGNFYFSYSSTAKSESQLKESYKFFHHVLQENRHNAFAANGLGMVCVKKNEVEVARETFTKAREANPPMSEDICTNLAHVYVLQKRIVEAERLYQATLKTLSSKGRSFSDRFAYLNECTAHAQHRLGRPDEAGKTLFRAIHLNPANLRFWYNAAFVYEAHGSLVSSRPGSSSLLVGEAQLGVIVAQKVFQHLGNTQLSREQRPFDKKAAAAHAATCSVKLQTLAQRLLSAQEREGADSALRRGQEEAHETRMRTLKETREAEARVIEEERERKRQESIASKKGLLENLQEQWATQKLAPVKEPREPGGATGKKRRRKGAAQVEDEDVDDKLMRDMLGVGGGNSRLNQALSSDEDASLPDADATQRQPSSRLRGKEGAGGAAAEVDDDDLFGDDSDDDRPSMPNMPSAPTPAAAESGNKRKKLRRNGTSTADQDEEEEGDAMNVSDNDQANPAPTRKSRVLDDDSD